MEGNGEAKWKTWGRRWRRGENGGKKNRNSTDFNSSCVFPYHKPMWPSGGGARNWGRGSQVQNCDHAKNMVFIFMLEE